MTRFNGILFMLNFRSLMGGVDNLSTLGQPDG